ncbi:MULTISPECIES: hypothetical protein [unclassified Cryobacterium]|uniref:hypothetical protein n=1 Tax=unclassified Cryobacterium TaxID=2649013 RepID=UPI002AB49F1A|nr:MULTISPECIES: hypothetical protein [unclassified Cryobacterium]MDY7529215.1 hypothetical protein [Cryobacterium sp. 10C2]MDY7558624.1 hypothetical protein [Cryobacterium sp. 10C3]MEB0202568.1 hypothetical protein [Cryobacterium sp. 5I3]MEB0289692.1 hypothetical protein [Cryobacterium sp. 10C2]
MTQNKNSSATATSRKKRLTIGAASVLAAGALLGTGMQGATASPLGGTAEPGTPSTPSASAPATPGASFFSSVAHELRGDLAHGQDFGEKAQKVAATISDHAELFASLPANLQADLTTLTQASDGDRTAAAEFIATSALAGNYGGQAQALAVAIQADPEHPLRAALHAALEGSLDAGTPGAGGDTATDTTDAGPAVTKLALSLVDNPALFDKLPVELQSALTALKALPAEQQDAAAQQIATDAGTGTYGPEIQKIAEHLAHGAAQDTGHDASGHDASGHADATAAH